MSWRRARQIASAVLVLTALVVAGVVAITVLLGRADSTDSTVGRLSARIATQPATTTTVPRVTTRAPARPAVRPVEKDRGEPPDD